VPVRYREILSLDFFFKKGACQSLDLVAIVDARMFFPKKRMPDEETGAMSPGV
jgi:hypothetical protein